MPVNSVRAAPRKDFSRRARVIKGVIRTPDKSGLEHYKGGLLRWLREMHTLEYTDPVFSKEQPPDTKKSFHHFIQFYHYT